jgi:regulator of sigma E protease
MQVLNMIFYAALTLGVLVLIHELGHFLAAKLTGMRVERFSIGFPPRAFGRKFGDTDYCVSWIPIGGYVKIAGMIDESFDTEFVNQEPQPWEFRAKSMPARMFVISAGVIMNILLAVGIFWGIHYSVGRDLKETTEIGYVIDGSAADKSGLRVGDRIIAVNGKQVTHWDEIFSLMYIDNLGNDVTLDLERNGEQKHIFVARKNIPQISDESFGIVEAHTQAEIEGIEPSMPADKLGIKAGDIIVALDSVSIVNDYQVVKIIHAHSGKALSISWKHNGQMQSGTATVTDAGRIGINIATVYTGPYRHFNYSLFEALPEGIKDIEQSTALFYRSIARLIAGKVSFKESFGGPIKIAQIATQSAEMGLASYLVFMGLLSMSLAILNILPFPALDGGHLVMLIYEKVFRREIPHRVKLAIQQAGFVLLLAFMAFVIYNDIANF